MKPWWLCRDSSVRCFGEPVKRETRPQRIGARTLENPTELLAAVVSALENLEHTCTLTKCGQSAECLCLEPFAKSHSFYCAITGR
jgi:hypothetical protein